ncbi:RecB family exonuclease [Bacillus mycoides]|uniref:RecB family exonuclease n=1 Tax=Bacillus mycoides TaxID=1405 RepID=UPI00027C1788|nr:PD-(D/E)XK nuclease family protein [Bacillus mycoides]EJV59321.1 hypothetical protein IEU_05586 [Bacillus mycoides]
MTYPLSYISYSQLSSFIDCPYTWYSTYILKQRSGNKYTSLGSAIHSVCEVQGKRLQADPPEAADSGQYFQYFNKIYFDNLENPKQFYDSKEDYVAMYKKGITAIENFLAEYQTSKPLFVEKKFKQVLTEGTPPALGFIDRIDGDLDRPWEFVVTDYKSGSNPKSKAFLNTDFQLAIYAQALYEEYDFYPAKLQYYHPVIDKFQTAVRIDEDGTYEYDYKGQRVPKARFYVPEKMALVKETVDRISSAYKYDEFYKKADKFGCRNCFHLETCKPFGDGTGWNSL